MTVTVELLERVMESQSAKLIKPIIKRKESFYEILTILRDNRLRSEVQLLAISLLSNIFEQFGNKFAYLEVIEQLLLIEDKITEEYVIRKLGIIIGRVYLKIFENTGKLNLDFSLTRIRPLKLIALSGFVDSLRDTATADSQKLFYQKYFLELFDFSFKNLEERLILFDALMQFFKQNVGHMSDPIIEYFSNGDFYNVLKQLSESQNLVAIDILSVIASLVMREYNNVFQSVVDCVRQILENKSLFPSTASIFLRKLGFVIQGDIDMIKMALDAGCELIATNFSEALDVLFAVLQMIPSESGSLDHLGVNSLLSDFINISFQNCAIRDVASDPLLNGVTDLILQRVSTREIEVAVEKIEQYLANSCFQALTEDLNRCISFTYVIARRILKIGNDSLCIRVTEAVLRSMDSLYEQIKSHVDNQILEIEIHGIAFLRIILSKLTETESWLQQLMYDEKTLISMIFNRLWNDIRQKICKKEALYSLNVLLSDTKCAMPILLETGCREILLTEYCKFPPEFCLFCITSRVMLSKDSEGKNWKRKYFDSILKNFQSQLISLDVIIYQIIASLFQCVGIKKDEYGDWKDIYEFFFHNFGQQLLNTYSEQPWNCQCNFIQYFVLSMPPSNPFSEWESDSYVFFRSIMGLMKIALQNLCRILNPIEFDDATELLISREGPINNKVTSTLDVKHICKSDDPWIGFEVLVFAVCYILDSPFPNYGIMEMYEDRCIFTVLDSLLDCLSKTSRVSILSNLRLVELLVDFVCKLSVYFRLEVLTNPVYCEFVTAFLKLSFLSSSIPIISRSCGCLICFLTSDETVVPQHVEFFESHFVLAFNVAIRCPDCERAIDFICLYCKLNYGFVDWLCNIITEDLQEDIKQQFSNGVQYLCDNCEDAYWCFRKVLSPLAINLNDLPKLRKYFAP